MTLHIAATVASRPRTVGLIHAAGRKAQRPRARRSRRPRPGRTVTEPPGRPGITCEVTDSSPIMPRRMEPGSNGERGRGLAIVAALARSSGVRASQGRQETSWVTLALTDRTHRAARQINHEPEAGRERR
jgi:hypothetical protein